MSSCPGCGGISSRLCAEGKCECEVRCKCLVDGELVSRIAAELATTEGVTLKFIKEVLRDIVLFDRKQRDYGNENISAFGELGVLVRANDKIARLKNLQGKEASNESLEDSWQDLSIYGVIARLVRNGAW